MREGEKEAECSSTQATQTNLRIVIQYPPTNLLPISSVVQIHTHTYTTGKSGVQTKVSANKQLQIRNLS